MGPARAMDGEGWVLVGRLFGTDGVRGVANLELSPLLAYRLGRATGALVMGWGDGEARLERGHVAGSAPRDERHPRPFVLVATDTRVSSGMLEAAVTAGLSSAGVDVVRLGVLPTPALSWLVPHAGAAAGIMISASHNPVEDNGIKIVGADGYKLPDRVEAVLERTVEEMDGQDRLPRPVGLAVGRVRYEPHWQEAYLSYLIDLVGTTFEGWRVVVDCANGAAHRLAPELLRRLGADVVAINTGDSGEDINVGCGSTHPERAAEVVRQTGARVGLTFDGDADRCIAIDEQGQVVDGDQILAICALERLRQGTLPGGAVAVTVYSNGGLREALRKAGGDVVVTPPGDRHVLEAMLQRGLVLGGEQSGHVIFLEHARTGDGILTGLMLLATMQRSGWPLSRLAAQMPRYPQVLLAARVASKESLLEQPEVRQVIEAAQRALGESGRILVRPSGTEPVVRVMVEGPDRQRVEQLAHEVVEVLERVSRTMAQRSEGVVTGQVEA